MGRDVCHGPFHARNGGVRPWRGPNELRSTGGSLLACPRHLDPVQRNHGHAVRPYGGGAGHNGPRHKCPSMSLALGAPAHRPRPSQGMPSTVVRVTEVQQPRLRAGWRRSTCCVSMRTAPRGGVRRSTLARRLPTPRLVPPVATTSAGRIATPDRRPDSTPSENRSTPGGFVLPASRPGRRLRR